MKATKIDQIFTVDLTLCSKLQIDGEDFVYFYVLLGKHELYIFLKGKRKFLESLKFKDFFSWISAWPPQIVLVHIGHPVEEANALQSKIKNHQEQLESLKKELEKLESVYNRFKGAYDNFDFENDAEDILDAMDYFSQNFVVWNYRKWLITAFKCYK